jgi:hypothetical protein
MTTIHIIHIIHIIHTYMPNVETQPKPEQLDYDYIP